jgi:hypothetical protein
MSHDVDEVQRSNKEAYKNDYKPERRYECGLRLDLACVIAFVMLGAVVCHGLE